MFEKAKVTLTSGPSRELLQLCTLDVLKHIKSPPFHPETQRRSGVTLLSSETGLNTNNQLSNKPSITGGEMCQCGNIQPARVLKWSDATCAAPISSRAPRPALLI